MKPFLSSEEAAKALGVSLETLYAYVSRGRIRSEPAEAGSRQRRYSAADVTALRERRTYRHSPQRAAGEALQWGWPVLESELTAIDQGRLYFRGYDAVELARTSSFESAAALLLGISPALFSGARARVEQSLESLPGTWRETAKRLPPVAALQAVLPFLDKGDPEAPVTSPEMMSGRAADLTAAAAMLATGQVGGQGRVQPVAVRLAKAWCPRSAIASPLLEKALILCMDHELNVSSFAVRTVSSSGASVYQAVAAGLAAMQGWRHGGMTRHVEALVEEAARRDDLGAALTERRERDGGLPGFGHPLYPHGDPRAQFLLEELARSHRNHPRFRLIEAVKTRGEGITGESPNVDFALVAIWYCLALPSHAALTLFFMGRSIGWVAHAAEQARLKTLIRPRAKYVGPAPHHLAQEPGRKA